MLEKFLCTFVAKNLEDHSARCGSAILKLDRCTAKKKSRMQQDCHCTKLLLIFQCKLSRQVCISQSFPSHPSPQFAKLDHGAAWPNTSSVLMEDSSTSSREKRWHPTR